LVVSPILVSFRETITADPSRKKEYNKEIVEASTPNKLVKIRMTAKPLPANLHKFFDMSGDTIRHVFFDNSEATKSDTIETFKNTLVKELQEAGEFWYHEITNYLWSFGPKRIGANILLNHIESYSSSINWHSMMQKIELEGEHDNYEATQEEFTLEKIKLLKDLDNSIVTGFQMATSAGPLCEEPMTGIAFFIEDIEIDKSILMSVSTADTYGPLPGQVISAVKEACRQAFLSRSVRLVEPLFLCEVQVASDVLGKAYKVLNKRRAKILREEIKEGTPLFIITAYLPAYESFGFADELYTKTSGAASPQLVFSHWELLDQDPFYVPSTVEELEEFGDNALAVGFNLARKLMDDVRSRKGLELEKQIVEKGDKQRTVKKNK